MNSRDHKSLKFNQQESDFPWFPIEIWCMILIKLSPADFRAFFFVSQTWLHFTKDYEKTYWKEQLTIKALKTRLSDKILSLKEAQEIEKRLLEIRNPYLDFFHKNNFSSIIQELFQSLKIPFTTLPADIQNLQLRSKQELCFFLASPMGIHSIIDIEKIPAETLFSNEVLGVLQAFRQYGFHVISTLAKHWGISLTDILSNQALIKETLCRYASFTLSFGYGTQRCCLLIFGISQGLTPELIKFKEIEDLDIELLVILCRKNGIALLKKEPRLIELYKIIREQKLARDCFEDNLYQLTGNQKNFDILQYVSLEVLLTKNHQIVPLLWTQEALDAFKTGTLLVKKTEEEAGVYFQNNDKNVFTMTTDEFEKTLKQVRAPKNYSFNTSQQISLFSSLPLRSTQPNEYLPTSHFKI